MRNMNYNEISKYCELMKYKQIVKPLLYTYLRIHIMEPYPDP